jgi:DNA-binding NarL/FixJ family response regulator
MESPGGRLRVVLVEPLAFVRAALRHTLSGDGLEIVGEAGTAKEALDLLGRCQADLLLLDIDLPGMDGLELLAEVRERSPGTRSVVLAASAHPSVVFEALRNGAVGFLTKDLTPEALRRAVRGIRDGELAMSRKLAGQVLLRQANGHRSNGPVAAENVTGRERQVLRRISEGLTDRQIATLLGVSPRTVESHVSSLLRKLGARSRAEAAGHYRDDT